MKYLKQITLTPIGKNTPIAIYPRNKNLIITGKNGSGKTTTLKTIYKTLIEKLISGDFSSELQISERIKAYENIEITHESHGDTYHEIISQRERLKKLKENNPFKFTQLKKFEHYFQNQLAVVEFFSADRQANITGATSASNTSTSRTQQPRLPIENNLESSIEQHITNLYIRKAIALSFKNDTDTANSIDSWLNQFERDLKHLTEDNSTEIEFDPYDFKVYIKQLNRERFTLQSISSGHSSILTIFSRLLMRAEFLQIIPSNLQGIVLIDEIDVHLHVSLQKIIFPFLINSFPNVQFIVSTHSPFILTSVDDAIIFDLTTEQHEEDISSYSYESVLEGLFGVHSASQKLQGKIKKLSDLTNSDSPQTAQIQKIVKELTPNIKQLDMESLFFFNKAVLKLTHKKSED